VTDYIVKHIKKVSLKKPILIEGLPGIGNVARISVDFLINKLKAKKILELYSFHFPNAVFLGENHKVEMPRIEFYHYKHKTRDIVFLIGDIQPADEYASYSFSEQIIEVAHSLKVSEIITLGGINSREETEKPKVYGAFTDESFIKPLKKIGVSFERKGSIILIGAAGLMLGLGELKKIKGFALLAETTIEQNRLGLNAAKAILLVLVKYLGLKISEKEINSDLKEFKIKPKIMKKIAGKPQLKPTGPINYIG